MTILADDLKPVDWFYAILDNLHATFDLNKSVSTSQKIVACMICKMSWSNATNIFSGIQTVDCKYLLHVDNHTTS